MTETPENAPDQDKKNVAEAKIVSNGIELCFRKPFLEETTIKRKVNDEDWNVIASKVHPPYIDTDKFKKGTHIEYKIELKGKVEEEFNLMVVL